MGLGIVAFVDHHAVSDGRVARLFSEARTAPLYISTSRRLGHSPMTMPMPWSIAKRCPAAPMNLDAGEKAVDATEPCHSTGPRYSHGDTVIQMAVQAR